MTMRVCRKGVDPDGLSYEEEFCGGSEPRGVMLFSDSAGAHFHLPYQWMYAPMLTKVSRNVSEYCMHMRCVCILFGCTLYFSGLFLLTI